MIFLIDCGLRCAKTVWVYEEFLFSGEFSGHCAVPSRLICFCQRLCATFLGFQGTSSPKSSLDSLLIYSLEAVKCGTEDDRDCRKQWEYWPNTMKKCSQDSKYVATIIAEYSYDGFFLHEDFFYDLVHPQNGSQCASHQRYYGSDGT